MRRFMLSVLITAAAIAHTTTPAQLRADFNLQAQQLAGREARYKSEMKSRLKQQAQRLEELDTRHEPENSQQLSARRK